MLFIYFTLFLVSIINFCFSAYSFDYVFSFLFFFTMVFRSTTQTQWFFFLGTLSKIKTCIKFLHPTLQLVFLFIIQNTSPRYLAYVPHHSVRTPTLNLHNSFNSFRAQASPHPGFYLCCSFCCALSQSTSTTRGRLSAVSWPRGPFRIYITGK